MPNKKQKAKKSAGNLLSSKETDVCIKVSSSGADLASQRANALLAIDQGLTRAKAAELSGLGLGQVQYLMSAFSKKRLDIFPDDLLTKPNKPADADKKGEKTPQPADADKADKKEKKTKKAVKDKKEKTKKEKKSGKSKKEDKGKKKKKREKAKIKAKKAKKKDKKEKKKSSKKKGKK